MTIKDWPAQERPREKLLEQGVAALGDAELLAVILRTGSRGRSAVTLARDLLCEFNGLRALLNAPMAQACNAHGLGVAKFSMLLAAVELARRHLQEDIIREGVMASPKLTREYLRSKLRDRRREIFCCLFLDASHRLITDEELFHGTIDSTTVYPRVVAERALAHNASAVIVAHNHPSGNRQPSQADLAITQRLRDALELLDIRLLDHFIIGDGEPLSLAERGEL